MNRRRVGSSNREPSEITLAVVVVDRQPSVGGDQRPPASASIVEDSELWAERYAELLGCEPSRGCIAAATDCVLGERERMRYARSVEAQSETRQPEITSGQ